MAVLAALLIATLGVQYALNVRNGRNNRRLREQQEQALIAGAALGVKSISSKPRLIELRGRENNPFLDPQTGRVENVIVVDSNWKLSDSLDLELLKVNGEYQDRYLPELTTLPPVMNINYLPEEDRKKFPKNPTGENVGKGSESHAFAVGRRDAGTSSSF